MGWVQFCQEKFNFEQYKVASSAILWKFFMFCTKAFKLLPVALTPLPTTFLGPLLKSTLTHTYYKAVGYITVNAFRFSVNLVLTILLSSTPSCASLGADNWFSSMKIILSSQIFSIVHGLLAQKCAFFLTQIHLRVQHCTMIILHAVHYTPSHIEFRTLSSLNGSCC